MWLIRAALRRPVATLVAVIVAVLAFNLVGEGLGPLFSKDGLAS